MAELQIKDPLKQPFDKVNAAVASAVFLISFIVYYMTVAPSFSFWDCGEFVAASHILGVAHPPGSPLYIIIGRIFSILPIAADIAKRVNLFSSVTSAGAALFGYLVMVRMIRYWFNKGDDLKNRITAYIGGFTGALFMAFSATQWSNSIEAEVYSPTMLLMMIILWVALKYFENKETWQGSRYMILIAYLAMLGVGIHLTIFVVVPVVALYFILKKEAGAREWGIISAFFALELYLIFALSSRPGEVAYYIPVIIVFIVFLFHALMRSFQTRFAHIALGIFLVTLYPLYFEIIESLSKKAGGSGLSDGLTAASELPIGWLGFFALIIWGLFSLTKYLPLREKNEVMAKEYLMTSVYCLIPPVLYGLGQVFSGYGSFIFLSVVFMLVIAFLLYKYINWLVLVAVAAMSSVMLGFIPLIVGLIGGLILVVILGLILKDENWKTATALVLVAMIGWSVHAYIPIRSDQNPIIDENNPETFDSFNFYLERKQYGSQSMTERMFVRRAEWANQFGDFRRMGFWRFFKQQYGLEGPRFFVIILLGLFGLWEMIRKRPALGLPFLLMIILCSIGLILYMNFADGTRYGASTPYDYLEVRDRDYFFTPAFILFGLAIGLGIAAFIDLIRDTFRQSSPGLKNGLFWASCLLVLMPLFPMTNNYFENDRSRNYMAYDYAYNQLNSCRPDAIYFTNADNETFPAWCIQEVYGVRKDVKVINLALSNTPWYLKQLRDNYKVPLNWTDAQIDMLRQYTDRNGKYHRIQDQAVEQVILSNNGKYPINAAVTMSSDNMVFNGRELKNYMTLEGMVYWLTNDSTAPKVNFEKTDSLYENIFQLRGISDPTIYKNEATARLANNYAQPIVMMADSLKIKKDYEGALEKVRYALKMVPQHEELYVYTAQTLGEMGRLDTLETFIENCPVKDKKKLYFNWGLAAHFAGREDEAIQVLEMTYKKYPNYPQLFKTLVRIYYENKMYTKLRAHVEDWVSRHPDDIESRGLLNQMRQVDRMRDTLEGQ